MELQRSVYALPWSSGSARAQTGSPSYGGVDWPVRKAAATEVPQRTDNQGYNLRLQLRYASRDIIKEEQSLCHQSGKRWQANIQVNKMNARRCQL
jgi:hypothetical protein